MGVKEPKLAGGNIGSPFLEAVLPDLRLDGELGLDLGLCIPCKGNIYKVCLDLQLCIPHKGNIYKVYVCFLLILFVAIIIKYVILITKNVQKWILDHKFVLKIATLTASYVFNIITLKCKGLNNHMRNLRIKQ